MLVRKSSSNKWPRKNVPLLLSFAQCGRVRLVVTPTDRRNGKEMSSPATGPSNQPLFRNATGTQSEKRVDTRADYKAPPSLAALTWERCTHKCEGELQGVPTTPPTYAKVGGGVGG